MSVEIVKSETIKFYARCCAQLAGEFLPYWEVEYGDDFDDPSTGKPFQSDDILLHVYIDLPETNRRREQKRKFTSIEQDFDLFRRSADNLEKIIPAVREQQRRPLIDTRIELPQPKLPEVAEFLSATYNGFNMIFDHISGARTAPPLTAEINDSVNTPEQRAFLEPSVTPEERVNNIIALCPNIEDDGALKRKITNAWKRYLQSLYDTDQAKEPVYSTEQEAKEKLSALIRETEKSHFVTSTFFFNIAYHFKCDDWLLKELATRALIPPEDEDYKKALTMVAQRNALGKRSRANAPDIVL